jgi:hypothetical protein
LINTPVSLANGGTGTSTPGNTVGTGLTASGAFPNELYALKTPVSVANGGTQCGAPATFVHLPTSPTIGEICTVTDATSCVTGSAVTAGGGSVNCQLTYNGTKWMPAGGAASSTGLAQLPQHQVTTSTNSQTLNATCDTGYPITEWDFLTNHNYMVPTIIIGGNCAQGQQLMVNVLEDGNGTSTPTLAAANGYTFNWQATGGIQPTLTSAQNARDGLEFQVSTYPSGNNLTLWKWLPDAAPLYAAPGTCPTGQFITATTTTGVICGTR